jgi:hypothetical protein
MCERASEGGSEDERMCKARAKEMSMSWSQAELGGRKWRGEARRSESKREQHTDGTRGATARLMHCSSMTGSVDQQREVHKQYQ